MISKHISCEPQNDNYKRLANYIADASHSGEKCLMSWCEGCEGSDNEYSPAIGEVVDIQALNLRTQKEKTYHLLVSFRIEDEGKLTQEDFKRIEASFALALGFKDHQRHCGVHINTENMHMHIAYNMIHPKKLTRHEPFRDYFTLATVCRELEQEYNLSIDNGIDNSIDAFTANHEHSAHQFSARSATKESLTGEESFERFVMDHHEKIMVSLNKAQTWEDVHQTFAYYGLEIKQRANGLAIKNYKGKQCLKASTFDRQISYKKLTERFGSFAPPIGKRKAKDWYTKKPLQADFTSPLWQEFKANNVKANNVKASRDEKLKEIKDKWYIEKVRITGLAVSRKTRSDLLRKTKLQERLELNEVRQHHSVASSNWLTFLQEKAHRGDEEALKLLRQKNSYPLPSQIKGGAFGDFKTMLEEQTIRDTTEHKIYRSDISSKSKKILTAVSRMEYVAKRLPRQQSNSTNSLNPNNQTANQEFSKQSDNDIDEKFTYRVTRTGAIIFEFESGAKIIDDKRKIHANDKGKELAKEYEGIKLSTRNVEKSKQQNKEISHQEIIEKNSIEKKSIDKEQSQEEGLSM